MDEDELEELVERKIDEAKWDWLTTESGPLWNWWTATLTVLVICIIGFGFCS